MSRFRHDRAYTKEQAERLTRVGLGPQYPTKEERTMKIIYHAIFGLVITTTLAFTTAAVVGIATNWQEVALDLPGDHASLTVVPTNSTPAHIQPACCAERLQP